MKTQITDAGMRYKANLKKTEEGYAAWAPGLPGCWSQGRTEKEALENIRDAIGSYLRAVETLSEENISRTVDVR